MAPALSMRLAPEKIEDIATPCPRDPPTIAWLL